MSDRSRSFITLSALLVLCGCAARFGLPAPAPASRLERPGGLAQGKAAASERAILSRYARQSECEGAAYARARDYAASRLNVLASAPTETGHINDAVANGDFRLRLAQAAARKRCFGAARQNYGEVLQVFTGPPYAALRRRAMDGLSALDGGPAGRIRRHGPNPEPRSPG